MSYIIKNTSGLINTRLTDVGRRNISLGSFNIAYFQIGDSEVNYTAVPNYNQTNNNILMPAFNAQNDTGSPQSNKQNIKYPYYVSGNNGGTYGLPFLDSQVQPVAAPTNAQQTAPASARTAAEAVDASASALLLFAPIIETVALSRTASGATLTVPSEFTVMYRVAAVAALAGKESAAPPMSAIAIDTAAIFWIRVILMYISIAYNLKEGLIVALHAV
jgi:hypothetical protein